MSGYRGAQFPWESSLRRGEEAAPDEGSAAAHEHHVARRGACVRAVRPRTDDVEYARAARLARRSRGRRWIESRVVETRRGFEIQRVTGVAEKERRRGQQRVREHRRDHGAPRGDRAGRAGRARRRARAGRTSPAGSWFRSTRRAGSYAIRRSRHGGSPRLRAPRLRLRPRCGRRDRRRTAWRSTTWMVRRLADAVRPARSVRGTPRRRRDAR